MTNPQFKAAAAEHEIEIMIDGKTHKGRYHLEHESLVVSFQGASKMVPQAGDNDAQARTILNDIVTAKLRKAN